MELNKHSLFWVYQFLHKIYGELFMYIMAMKDESIMKLVAKFCFEVLTTFHSLLE